MFHPLAAGRVRALMPEVKLIVLLRDPVERAYSHWKERRGEGCEPLSFAGALAAEEERTAGERERLIAEPDYHSTSYDWYSYRARGRYLEHLEPWLAAFDRTRMMFLPSETFYRSPAGSYARVLDFLELPPLRLPAYDVFNDRPSSGMDDLVREDLIAHYRPHNEALSRRLDLVLPWS
jgi:hypothetical protein